MLKKNLPVRSLNLLIIDDEVEIAEILHETLEEIYDVQSAYSVASGLALIEKQIPDLILCDMTMPRQSGADFYKILTEKYQGLQDRMIFMTGGSNNPEKLKFLKAIQNPVIEKPFLMTALIETLQKMANQISQDVFSDTLAG